MTTLARLIDGGRGVGWLVLGGVIGSVAITDQLGALVALVALVILGIKAPRRVVTMGLVVAGCGGGASVALAIVDSHSPGVILGVALSIAVFVIGAVWSYIACAKWDDRSHGLAGPRSAM
jgi:uncharacterized membrane protein AbrB (regulator of aidB expression)